jgi:hypothetical protein
MASQFQDRLSPSTLSIEGFLSTRELRAAPVQRDYQWTEVHVDALLRDIARQLPPPGAGSLAQPYFIGTMVACRDGELVYLYDGLQRTTTLVLLLAVLRDRVADPALARRLHNAITLHGRDGQAAGRLILPEPDTTLQDDVFPPGRLQQFSGRGKYGRGLTITRAVRAIEAVLKAKGGPDPDALARQVLDATLLTLVETKDPDLALLIFRSINKPGLPLAPKDLIKSQLPTFAEDAAEAERLIMRWERVQQRVQEDFAGFVQTMSSVTLRRFEKPGLAAEALVGWMRETYARDPKRLDTWLSRAEDATGHWRHIHDITQSGATNRHALWPLLPVWVFRWTYWQPLALRLMMKSRRMERSHGHGAARRWLARQCDTLQRRCMALELAAVPTVRRLDRFQRALVAVERGADPFTGPLAVAAGMQRRIRARLRKSFTDPELRVDLFKWIEAQGHDRTLRHLRRQVDTEQGETPEVEHVLPQSVVPGSDWLAAFPDYDERLRLTDRLGNLALVPRDVNTELEDKPFADKRAILEASAKVARYRTAMDILGEAEWTPEVIDRRTDRVGELVWTLLEIPGEPAFNTWEPEDTDADLPLEDEMNGKEEPPDVDAELLSEESEEPEPRGE